MIHEAYNAGRDEAFEKIARRTGLEALPESISAEQLERGYRSGSAWARNLGQGNRLRIGLRKGKLKGLGVVAAITSSARGFKAGRKAL